MKKILVVIMLALPALGLAQEIGNYLVMNDIGEYIFRPKRVVTIGNAGVLVPTGHFPGHGDMTYEGIYIHPQTYLGVEVKITQHSGSDSDKWLLHEVERGFRRGNYEENMTPARFRNIDGKSIFYSGLGGGTYGWLSNNVVVSIEYVDLYKQKSEPLEVVKAYLAKFPSTIPSMTMDRAHDEQWIKDEMDRRLWLCDKWDAQFQSGKVAQADLLKELVDHMNVFLDYRQKYYGISATNDKKTLANYLYQNDITSIKNKLAEYKTWWSANKGGSLIGILSIYAHRAYNHVSSLFGKVFAFLTSLWERLRAIFG